ncbi:MAG TPA: MurR/RpiR family transcriptional regulator [Candidatus Binatia bacterium]|nr:MurR/RpiR family transcriptional regulator [Candidatus Binatia bacterium]
MAAITAAAQNGRDFLRRVQASSLSPKRREIAEYLATNYRTAVGQTAAELAAAMGTSEATVIRVARELGYDGFPELRRQLHEMVREDLTSLDLLKRERSEHAKHADTIAEVASAQIEHLHAMVANVPRAEFRRLVDVLVAGKRVYVAGHRASAALASFFGYELAKVHPDVVTLCGDGSAAYDAFRVVPRGAWLIGIAYPRYPRETLELLEFAREERIAIAVITDSVVSPAAKRADLTLPVAATPVSFVSSHAAPQTLISALLVEYGLRARRRTEAMLGRFERIAERRRIFHTRT